MMMGLGLGWELYVDLYVYRYEMFKCIDIVASHLMLLPITACPRKEPRMKMFKYKYYDSLLVWMKCEVGEMMGFMARLGPWIPLWGAFWRVLGRELGSVCV
jgi:hypothetical protein